MWDEGRSIRLHAAPRTPEASGTGDFGQPDVCGALVTGMQQHGTERHGRAETIVSDKQAKESAKTGEVNTPMGDPV